MNVPFSLKLLAVLLPISAASVHAAVPIICWPGEPVAQSEGVLIRPNGTIEILDFACRRDGGTVLPPALGISNVSASPTSVSEGGTSTLTATLTNLIANPTADTFDQCRVRVLRPNGTLSSEISITPLQSAISVPVSFPTGSTAGAWSLRLECERFVANQQLVVTQPAAQTVNVTSEVIPPDPVTCDSLTPPFVNGLTTEFSAPGGNGFGVTFGSGHAGPIQFATGNVFQNNLLSQIRVRAFRFVAPTDANKTGNVKLDSTSGSIAWSISTQCGNFNVVQQCRHYTGNQIDWSTNSAHSWMCRLQPGTTYYANFAYFDLPAFLSSGGTTVNSTCQCTGPNCTSVCQFVAHAGVNQ